MSNSLSAADLAARRATFCAALDAFDRAAEALVRALDTDRAEEAYRVAADAVERAADAYFSSTDDNVNAAFHAVRRAARATAN